MSWFGSVGNGREGAAAAIAAWFFVGLMLWAEDSEALSSGISKAEKK